MDDYFNPKFKTSTPNKNPYSNRDSEVSKIMFRSMDDMSSTAADTFKMPGKLRNHERVPYFSTVLPVKNLPVSPRLKERVRQRLFDMVNKIDGYSNKELQLLDEEEYLQLEEKQIHESDMPTVQEFDDASESYPQKEGYALKRNKMTSSNDEEIKELKERVQFLEQTILNVQKQNADPNYSTKRKTKSLENSSLPRIFYKSEDETSVRAQKHISRCKETCKMEIQSLQKDLKELNIENQFLRLKIKQFHDNTCVKTDHGIKRDQLMELMQGEIKKYNEQLHRNCEEELQQQAIYYSAQLKEYKKAIRILKNRGGDKFCSTMYPTS